MKESRTFFLGWLRSFSDWICCATQPSKCNEKETRWVFRLHYSHDLYESSIISWQRITADDTPWKDEEIRCDFELRLDTSNIRDWWQSCVYWFCSTGELLYAIPPALRRWFVCLSGHVRFQSFLNSRASHLIKRELVALRENRNNPAMRSYSKYLWQVSWSYKSLLFNPIFWCDQQHDQLCWKIMFR